jgi:uncharacterized protein with ParB-like and HNH nuclease domain
VEAGPRTVKFIFEQSRRLVVPLFQRPYVWKREEQWEPLWHDVQTLADRVLAGKEVRPHFLGAVVLDQVRKPVGHMETRTIIDGQQRLTTLQLFLEAFSDLCRARGDERHTVALLKLTRNDDPLSDDDDEDFKVWPTNVDRQHFRQVMEAQSPDALLSLYGKQVVNGQTGSHIADAYLFFHRTIDAWLGTIVEHVPERIAALYSTLREHLQLVVIDLANNDDPQMIFETLNARGTPLLPSDLVKNFLFNEVQKRDLGLEVLYNKHWRHFDDDNQYWRADIGRGHARRARVDLFLQHYLTLKREDEVEVAQLYSSYRTFALDSGRDARELLEELHTYSTVYRGFDSFPRESRRGQFFSRLTSIDVGTAYPFLLELFHRFGHLTEAIDETLALLESWLVRRTVCKLNTRGYNRLFIELLATLREDATNVPGRVRAYLLSSNAESNRWPDDKEFAASWHETPVYEVLVRDRVRMLLEALEMQRRTSKSEKVTLQEKLTIEHVMPQQWTKHWPLPSEGDDEDLVTERNRLVQTMGNLTLVTKALNPAMSNGPWSKKRHEIQKHSLLKLNSELASIENWDEQAIRARGDALLNLAIRIWPFPS